MSDHDKTPVSTTESKALDALVRVVVEDADAGVRREQDRALNESRRLVLEAEDRVGELERAARELGQARGAATDEAEQRAAEQEVAGVGATAFHALLERFHSRVEMGLKALPGTDRYAAALETWARGAAIHMDRPAEVFTAKRDRAAVYGALLSTEAEDFQVRVDHGVHVGFVVRDLDGRLLFDAQPAALVEAHAGELERLLKTVVPERPSLPDSPELISDPAPTP